MTDQRPSYNPVKTMVFIIIGALAIGFTDIVILKSEQNIADFGKIVSEWVEGDGMPVDVASLRTQHEVYMEEGIALPEQYARSTRPAPLRSMKAELVEVASLPKSVPLHDLIEQERLAEIQPAVGSAPQDDVLLEYSDVFERGGGDADDEKNMVDVIFGLNSDAAEEALPEGIDESVDVALASEVLETVYQYEESKGSGKVVIIIDDMGLSLRSRQVEVMDGPLTLAYLPYAEGLKERTKRARDNGHEVMVHMPMEAMNGGLDGGPRVLRVSQDAAAFDETVEWGLSQFEGYVGVNNHMGSRLTQDKDAMQRVMAALKKRGVYFVDSKTIGSSVAADVARQVGVPYAERDVFLDHQITIEFVRGALRNLEQVAKRKGYAIAIGHPHKETIAALKEWLPTLEAKGLTLVPASAVVRQPVAVNDNDGSGVVSGLRDSAARSQN